MGVRSIGGIIMRMRTRIALSTTLATLLATPGWAQDAQLGDIVVTAQRREQSLQKVPISVTRAGRRKRSNAPGSRDLTAYAALVPNFKAVYYGNPGASDVSIRGRQQHRRAEFVDRHLQ